MASVVPVLTDDLCSAQQSQRHHPGHEHLPGGRQGLVTAGPAGSASLPLRCEPARPGSGPGAAVPACVGWVPRRSAPAPAGPAQPCSAGRSLPSGRESEAGVCARSGRGRTRVSRPDPAGPAPAPPASRATSGTAAGDHRYPWHGGIPHRPGAAGPAGLGSSCPGRPRADLGARPGHQPAGLAATRTGRT